jgi:polyhydroxyalkanoate synthase
MREFIERQKDNPQTHQFAQTQHITDAFMQLSQHMMQQPMRYVEASMNLWGDYMKLWHGTAQRFFNGQTIMPVITPAPTDKRFKDNAWSENALFDYIKQSYLLSSRWLQGITNETEGLDEKTARKVDFYTRQFVDAISPSNFALTNPEVLRRTVETGGDNLIKGFENLLHDLERGNGMLKISMTDENAFEVGKTIANTDGKVIFQNDLMQLIQYDATTPTVFSVPLLIIPPWINKFYILDLGEKKSLVKYLVENGFTVFMISWVNPDESLAEKSFEDYMLEGPMTALQQISKICSNTSVNITGYCLGGTLLASMLAYLEYNKKEKAALPAIASATYLVTMLDFDDVGDIAVFIDDEQLGDLEERMNAVGFLDAQSMATTFNMLRSNDLIWSFVVNNYLMGKEPFPFDLLYWNSDSTRMPAAMHSFYLREMYQQNKLVVPGAVKLNGAPIDLQKISTPAFFLSTREDHIAPWRTTYLGTQLMQGPVRFVLSASGHIAGVVNPPQSKKYNYWTNDHIPKSSEAWMKSAVRFEGSWWGEWRQWLTTYSGDQVPARMPGDQNHTIIENAPGSYVRVKA